MEIKGISKAFKGKIIEEINFGTKLLMKFKNNEIVKFDFGVYDDVIQVDINKSSLKDWDEQIKIVKKWKEEM